MFIFLQSHQQRLQSCTSLVQILALNHASCLDHVHLLRRDKCSVPSFPVGDDSRVTGGNAVRDGGSVGSAGHLLGVLQVSACVFPSGGSILERRRGSVGRQWPGKTVGWESDGAEWSEEFCPCSHVQLPYWSFKRTLGNYFRYLCISM